jgi:hypothetical protein
MGYQMKFVAYLKQIGDGCDYTIGCGQKLIGLDAQTWAEARAEMRKLLADNYSHDESRLETVTIYEVKTAERVPVDDWYAEIEDEEDQAQEARDKENRRREYERLKREFGGP